MYVCVAHIKSVLGITQIYTILYIPMSIYGMALVWTSATLPAIHLTGTIKIDDSMSIHCPVSMLH